MDLHCRRCGKDKRGGLMTDIQRRIMTYVFPDENFDSTTLILCRTCGPDIMKFRKHYYNNRPIKSKLKIVFWNEDTSSPIFSEDGTALRYQLPKTRRLDGQTRNSTELPANIGVVVPYLDTMQQVLEMPLEQTSNTSSQTIAQLSLQNVQRRSSRNKNIKEDKMKKLHFNILHNVHDGLEIIDLGLPIGLGVQTTKSFIRNDFITTYKGERLNKEEAAAKEMEYEEKFKEGEMCYCFYFKYEEQSLCLDATSNDGSYGRLMNHSFKKPNIQPKVISIDGTPYVYFVALHTIQPFTELRWDYGDRKTPLDWLKE